MSAPHEPTDACAGIHCYTHDVDEPTPPDGGYVGCAECGHLYRTPGELRRAYRRVWTEMLASALRQQTPDNPGFGSRWGTVWCWLRSRFVRARSIYFCQHCIHHF